MSMFDFGKLKKIFYSQQAYTALRMTLGTILPGVLLMLLFNQPVAGLSCALGAFCTSYVDVPAPLWQKHRHMLLGTFVAGIVSILILLASPHPVSLWIVLLGVCFAGGLAVAYGTLPTAMGTTAMMAMVMMLTERGADVNLWTYFVWLVLGGLWYTYFCLFMCRLFQHQIAQRALAECLFATADYLNARSQCYMPEIPLEQCYRAMLAAQVAVVEAQQAARNVVLSSLFSRQQLTIDPQRIRLFNILIDVIDMHDSVLAMQTNYENLRRDFAQTNALDFMRDLLHKTVRELSRVAQVIVTGKSLLPRFNAKAELRALEYEIVLAQAQDVEAAPVLKVVYSRGSAIVAMMEKLIQDLQSTTNTSGLSLEVIKRKYYDKSPSKDGAHWHLFSLRPALRYAIRLTLAIALGMAISEHIGGHSIWIVITILMVLRPSFGLTQQRNKHRLIGTLLGCMVVPVILWGVSQPTTLFWVMAVSFLLCFSFMQLNYLISVFFTTVALLLLYHFMLPSLTLTDQRIIDTIIGTVVGAVAGYVFPSWEYQLLAPQIAAVLRTCRRYGREVFAPVLNAVEYRLSRREALVALTTLSASYQRMLQDPVAKQHQAQKVGEFVLQCNLLISEIAALAHVRLEHSEISQQPSFQTTAQIIDAALTGTRIKSDDLSQLLAIDELFPMRQSALNIMQISATLTLPGLRRMLSAESM